MTDAIARLTTALADRYTIERELGAGGMATVYLAHDVRHDRKVALKVLRPELAAILGGERFLAEIKTTANLQHPHILSLFDSGEADGLVFYVMPYVEGESLRDRLTREHQLPVEEAVQIAREVASALDYAHRHGVVHRDIKPENILLHEGQALVADFGIALAASRSDKDSRMTETGMSLGTPHYMAPEQAMGEREITAKADIYALGCVVYEMLVGEPPFTGPTAQAIVARVMTETPRSLTLQRHTVPAYVEAAVMKALEKLPADRFASAAQFGEALAGTVQVLPVTRAGTAARPARRGPVWMRYLPRALPWAVAALAAVLGAWGWLRSPRSAAPLARHLITLSDSVALRLDGASVLAISPDGSHVAFVSDSGVGRLWVRRLDDLHAQPLLGTDGARWPTFSPDGAWIAFVSGTRLMKIRVDGGATITLADSASSGFGGAAWLDDGTIVYADLALQLRRISDAGGSRTTVASLEKLAGFGAAAPEPLPGHRGVLFRSCNSNCFSMDLRVLDLRTLEQATLVADAVRGWYLPTGHLLYVRRDGAALAAPFDVGRLRITGAAVPVLESVGRAGGSLGGSTPELAVSATGTLVYSMGGAATSGDRLLMRVERSGRATPIDSTWFGAFNSFALSRDGRRLAVGTASGSDRDIWIKHLPNGPFTRLTFSGRDRRPVWSADDNEVAFVRDTASGGDVYVKQADGNGADRRLARLNRPIQEVEWSRDGQWLLLRTDNAATGHGDIVGVRTRGDSTPVPLVSDEFEELQPSLSADGRWLAYTSNESGRQDVYVRPFPNTSAGRWQVSIGGGTQARWSRDGRELFYLSSDGHLMSARIAAGASFAVVQRTPLFLLGAFDIDTFHSSFEVTADGRGFIFSAVRDLLHSRPVLGRLVLVENWFGDVRARTSR